MQIGLRLFVQRLWHCAKDIGGLVDPAPLLTRGREDIPQRRPEPKRTVPGSQLRRHREAAFLHRADPGHNFALRQEPMADQALAPFFVQKMRMSGHETRHLRLDGRTQQLTRSGLDHLCKWIW